MPKLGKIVHISSVMSATDLQSTVGGGNIGDMEKRIAAVRNEITGLNHVLTEIRDYLATMSEDMRVVRNDIGELKGDFRELKGRVDAWPSVWQFWAGIAAMLGVSVLAQKILS